MVTTLRPLLLPLPFLPFILSFDPFEPFRSVVSNQESHGPDEDHDTENIVSLFRVLTPLSISYWCSCRSCIFDRLSRLGQRLFGCETAAKASDSLLANVWTFSSSLICMSSSVSFVFRFPLFTVVVHAITSECFIRKFRKLLVCRSRVFVSTSLRSTRLAFPSLRSACGCCRGSCGCHVGRAEPGLNRSNVM